MPLDLVERDVDLGGVDLRRPAALIARLRGHRADDGQLFGAVEGEEVVVVAQQHDRLRGRLTRQRVMGVDVECAVLRTDVRCCSFDERDHPVGRLLQCLRVEAAVIHSGRHVVVEFVAPERHHQVESGGHRADAVDHRTPVADHHAVESPSVSQDSGE